MACRSNHSLLVLFIKVAMKITEYVHNYYPETSNTFHAKYSYKLDGVITSINSRSTEFAIFPSSIQQKDIHMHEIKWELKAYKQYPSNAHNKSQHTSYFQ